METAEQIIVGLCWGGNVHTELGDAAGDINAVIGWLSAGCDDSAYYELELKRHLLDALGYLSDTLLSSSAADAGGVIKDFRGDTIYWWNNNAETCWQIDQPDWWE